LKELKRLQTEKTALESRFNDLAVMQAQVRKLKNELSVAQNLDWIRRGIYDAIKEKGGERLISPPNNSSPEANPALNVELHRTGETNILSPPPGDIPAK
jgi:hypothetical protein